jgi:hypothetical protein
MRFPRARGAKFYRQPFYGAIETETPDARKQPTGSRARFGIHSIANHERLIRTVIVPVTTSRKRHVTALCVELRFTR